MTKETNQDSLNNPEYKKKYAQELKKSNLTVTEALKGWKTDLISQP